MADGVFHIINETRINGIGIDHNETSVVLNNVAEHMDHIRALELLATYQYLLKKADRIIVITPQEAGFRSDDTHLGFMDFDKVRGIFDELGYQTIPASFTYALCIREVCLKQVQSMCEACPPFSDTFFRGLCVAGYFSAMCCVLVAYGMLLSYVFVA